MAICKAKELAAYIKNEYSTKYNIEVSPIKMQKSLYFCLAFWGGFIRKGKSTEQKEMSFDYDETLFDERIEAWIYGPVVVDVYKEENIDSYYKENLFAGNECAKEFIDDVLNDISGVSDFRLVDRSHLDSSWINHFDINDTVHNKRIPQEEIIEEYARR